MSEKMGRVKMTPGPWAVSCVDNDGVNYPHGLGLQVIDTLQELSIADCDMDGPLDTCAANARAIAALPELVEAARAIWKQAGDTDLVIPAEVNEAINALEPILARIDGDDNAT